VGELPIVGREVAALVLLAQRCAGTLGHLDPQILDLIDGSVFL